MAYQITEDGYVLHDPRLNDATRIVFNPVLTQEANLAAALSFTLMPNHARYSDLARLKSVVEVFDDGVRIFRGRVLNDTRGWNNDKAVVCEGDLAMLSDTHVRPYNYEGNVLDYFTQLITQHNEQVPEEKRFTVRTVTVEDPNEYITRADSEYPTTYSEISEKLIGHFGGYLIVEYVDGVNYIDYLEDSPYETLQHIVFGSNLLGFSEENRGEDIITALIPLGARFENEDIPDNGENEPGEGDDENTNGEDETGEEGRVTIESVNEGLDYIVDEDSVEKYGLIFGTETWDDVHEPANLLTKGTAKLAERIRGWNKLELTAVDLSLVDKSIDEFRFLEYVQVDDEPHNISGRFLIRRLVTDMANPQNSTLTIGDEVRGLSSYVSDTQKKTEAIYKDYVINEQVKAVVAEVRNVSSSIIQNANNIMLQVSELYVGQSDYQQQLEYIATQISQTASDITFTFNNLSEQINHISGDTQAQFNETAKYIRFVDGTIIIGQEGDPLEVHISNDTMGFLQNGVQVTYINSNKLYVTDGEFLNSLELGSFAFFPRANSNLSFRKVK